MRLQTAQKKVLAFLQAELDKRGEPGKYKPKMYLWPNREDIRVAEVDFTFGVPGMSGSGGSSYMQVDVPHGVAVCALTERLLISLIESGPTDELEDDKWRLVEAIWGEHR